MKRAALTLVALVVASGCGGGENPRSADPRAQASETPQGEIRSGAEPVPGYPRLADTAALERFIRRWVNDEYAASGTDARIVQMRCLPARDHVRLCPWVESDGRNDVMIAWGNAAHDRLVAFQPIATLTCGVVEQGRADWYAEGLARFARRRFLGLRPRPTLKQLRRAAQREAIAVCREIPADRDLEDEPLVRVERQLVQG